MHNFRDVLEDCSLSDLGFTGRWYTWEGVSFLSIIFGSIWIGRLQIRLGETNFPSIRFNIWCIAFLSLSNFGGYLCT